MSFYPSLSETCFPMISKLRKRNRLAVKQNRQQTVCKSEAKHFLNMSNRVLFLIVLSQAVTVAAYRSSSARRKLYMRNYHPKFSGLTSRGMWSALTFEKLRSSHISYWANFNFYKLFLTFRSLKESNWVTKSDLPKMSVKLRYILRI